MAPIFLAAALMAAPTDPAPPSAWSLTAGGVGVATGLATLGFSLASEQLKRAERLEAIPVGGVALGLAVLAPPAVFLAGWLGRRRSATRGAPALRVLGWIFYGGALATGVALGVFGARKKEPPDGLVGLTGGFSALSTAFMAADGFISWHQARRRRDSARPRTAQRTSPRLLPWLSPIPGPQGGAGGLVGVVGSF